MSKLDKDVPYSGHRQLRAVCFAHKRVRTQYRAAQRTS